MFLQKKTMLNPYLRTWNITSKCENSMLRYKKNYEKKWGKKKVYLPTYLLFRIPIIVALFCWYYTLEFLYLAHYFRLHFFCSVVCEKVDQYRITSSSVNYGTSCKSSIYRFKETVSGTYNDAILMNYCLHCY